MAWYRVEAKGADDPTAYPEGHESAVWLPGWREHLYRVDALRVALEQEPMSFVCFPEGEKDADALAELGFVAVASVGGAHAEPSDEALEPLRDCNVVLFGDNDEAGRARVERLMPRLASMCSVRSIIFDDLPNGGDVADWIARAAEAGA